MPAVRVCRFEGIICKANTIYENDMKDIKLRITLILSFALILLAGCALNPPQAETAEPAATATLPPAAEDTQVPVAAPTEAAPVAARVNGEEILQSSLDASLNQLNQALQTYPDLLADGQTPQALALQSLVDRALLSQAARAAGFSADAQMVADKMAELTAQAGGEEAFNTWLTAQGYTLETFQRELPWELEAAWQRDQLAVAVPEAMEQVRARQFLFYESYQADRIYGQLTAGVPVDQVVANNDPDNSGYLGWLPRGVLIYPELEEALFALQPGGVSPVIQTEAGYHIMVMLDKQDAYPLSPEIHLLLQEQAVETWLETQRSQATVEVLVP